jgi:hypothetical protein
MEYAAMNITSTDKVTVTSTYTVSVEIFDIFCQII